MNLIESLKSYFTTLNSKDNTPKAPVGVCPNCWGKQDWDGNYYEFVKGEKSDPSKETYNSFVQDVARKLDKIVIHKSDYICKTCKTDFSHLK